MRIKSCLFLQIFYMYEIQCRKCRCACASGSGGGVRARALFVQSINMFTHNIEISCPECKQGAVYYKVSTITNHHPEMRVILLHSSGSPKLANRTKFPYSLGILGSTQPLVDLFCSHLCTKAAGKTFLILCDRDQLYYSTIMKDFIASVDKTVGVDYLSAFTLTRYPLHEILSSRVMMHNVCVCTIGAYKANHVLGKPREYRVS